MSGFSAQVDAWVAQTKERQTAVYRRSVELLAEDMAKTKPQGGRVPFLTGNLARSLLASVSGMPSISGGNFRGSNVGAVTATLEYGQAVWLGYQAAYARRRNYGFVGKDSLGRSYDESGDHFVEGAIENWQAIVDQAVKEIKA